MSCLQAIEGEDTNNPLICQILNLLWALSDKGTCVRFCWVPSHCGIEGNEIVDQLAKETLDHDIDQLTTVHFADLKPLVNSYIQQEVQIKWDQCEGDHELTVKHILIEWNFLKIIRRRHYDVTDLNQLFKTVSSKKIINLSRI